MKSQEVNESPYVDKERPEKVVNGRPHAVTDRPEREGGNEIPYAVMERPEIQNTTEKEKVQQVTKNRVGLRPWADALFLT